MSIPEQELDELFNKPDWTDEDAALLLELLKGRSLSDIQKSFAENFISSLSKVKPENSEHARQLLQMIHERMGIAPQLAQPRIISISRRFSRIAAAVVLLIGLGGIVYVTINRRSTKPDIATVQKNQDIKAPSSNRATITLSNGQKMFLDSAAKGTLAFQGNVKLEKAGDGKIVYSGNEQLKNALAFNTLTNPRGSKVIDITLSDGTQVWLNAASSIRYPVAFAGSERKVEIAGEAYFEVAHDPAKPFKVAKGNTEVEVLGTHFNINAYDDEENIKVTLLEGSVVLSQENSPSKKILHPGEQGVVAKDIMVRRGINVEQVMAWKNGMFKFDHTDLKVIMRQIARWYDVDISYQGNIPEALYNGDVPRNASASEVLKVLQYTGANFSIEGNKIIVRP